MPQDLLLPNRHPHRDFFIADIFDNIPLKDDMASMEHPVFSLSTKPDCRPLEYKREGVEITIEPGVHGLPTIFDKDILLYCISLMMAEINQGRIPPRTLRISTHDLLVATNRPTNNLGYARLKEALKRLNGVAITTNIKTNKRTISGGFHLIEGWQSIESSRVKRRMVRLEITPGEWIYNSILGKEVLTINKEYFRLRKPLERRLYELARKHCGKDKKEWSISLPQLHAKSGSGSSEEKFRFFVNQIAKTNHLPDYSVAMKNDLVMFTNREFKKPPKPPVSLGEGLPKLKFDTIEKGAVMTKKASTGWDYQEIRRQFSQSLMKGKFKPDNIDGAFIAFVKKKIAEQP